MMLDYNLCRKCYFTRLDKVWTHLRASKKTPSEIDWSMECKKIFDYTWESKKHVLCPCNDYQEVQVTDNPPNSCPYLLEHTLNEEECKEDNSNADDS
jgi:hypothetical protein